MKWKTWYYQDSGRDYVATNWSLESARESACSVLILEPDLYRYIHSGIPSEAFPPALLDS